VLKNTTSETEKSSESGPGGQRANVMEYPREKVVSLGTMRRGLLLESTKWARCLVKVSEMSDSSTAAAAVLSRLFCCHQGSVLQYLDGRLDEDDGMAGVECVTTWMMVRGGRKWARLS